MTISTNNRPLQNLLHLAEEKSPQGRNVLFTGISDLMLDHALSSNDHERALMVEILNQLILDVEIQVRQALAQRLAKNARAPKELVVMLANDEIDVARPILLNSNLLRDHELLEIIKHRTQEHQMAIAMRENVSEIVSSALVETGQEDVITSLLQNPAAQISQATLEYLVEQSQRVDSYQNPLLSRGDLQPELAKKMYSWVSESLKEKIIEDFKIDRSEIDDLIGESDSIMASHDDPDSSQKTMELVDAIVKNRELTPGLLSKTLRDGEIPLFIGMFSRLTDLELKSARKIIFDGEGEVIALACKAIGFETHQFSDLYKLVRITRAGTRDVRISEMSHLLSYFEQMKKVTAQNILRSWQRDPSYLDALNKNARNTMIGNPVAPQNLVDG